MAQYRKKPVVIEATQWFKIGDHPKVTLHSQKDGTGWIKTLEGGHIVTPGDWIIFAITYEPVTGKEVMPSEARPNRAALDTAPAGLSAGGGADTASKILRTLEKQTAHGERAEHSRIGHLLEEASWHIHLAGFRSRNEAQAALDAILTAQPAMRGSE